MNYEKTIQNIRAGLKDYIISHNIKSLILGVSGGIDSCLCAALARPVCDDLGIPLIGASLPSETNEPEEIKRAQRTLDAFCHRQNTLYIDTMYKAVAGLNKFQYTPEINDCDKSDEETYIELLKLGDEKHSQMMKAWKIRRGNLKARIRMIYLYNLASMWNGIVLSTDNYTEYMLGFWTLHGDVGDYGMIQNLWKTEVYDLAEWLAYNECKSLEQSVVILGTIEAMATDGLGVTNLGDLGQILPEWKGSSREGYKEVDRILQVWEAHHLLEPTSKTLVALKLEKHPVIQRHLSSEFKRNNPYNISRNNLFKTE